jgi:hypothetical protein
MKKTALYVPVFSLTLLLSAALLFSVQPMFSKMILPLLGGTPQVWNTAMLFFQVMLLAGYAYAHGTSRFLSTRIQAVLHIGLLAIFFLGLPFAIPAAWEPPTDTDPRPWQLWLMLVTIGGPFFVLSASAPMLQRWFAGSDHKDAANPYFLYGASNLGSLAALFAYPFIIEPLMTVTQQTYVWQMAYVALIALTVFSSVLMRNNMPVSKNSAAQADEISWNQRLVWLLLAFIPSSLMLGVTTYITTDIASVPLLWVMPLALYVGTFIFAFARRQLLTLNQITFLQGLFLVLVIMKSVSGIVISPWVNIGLHLSLFFFTALMCHSQLAALKPSASKLTEFFLILSIGGALGGFFNAIIAPSFFIIPIEYGLVLILALFVRHYQKPANSFSDALVEFRRVLRFKSGGFSDFEKILNSFLFFVFLFFAVFSTEATFKFLAALIFAYVLLNCAEKRWLFAVLSTVLLIFFMPGSEWNNSNFQDVKYRDRNFFGVMKVVDTEEEVRMLLHGTTNHGTQPLDPALRLEKVSYYGEDSPISDIFEALDQRNGKQNIAILGLGIGVTACYQKADRHFDFFEIDPAIVEIAQNKELFTYLSDCKSPYDVILGDARLTMAKQPDQRYDLILADAFSSDNVPAHLLTQEAIKMYLTKLKPDGFLVFHVSNNHLDLEPMLAKSVQEMGLFSVAKASIGDELKGTKIGFYPAHFIVISANDSVLETLRAKFTDWSDGRTRGGIEPWTDQFSNIVSVFGNQIGKTRMKEVYDKTHPDKKTEKP